MNVAHALAVIWLRWCFVHACLCSVLGTETSSRWSASARGGLAALALLAWCRVAAVSAFLEERPLQRCKHCYVCRACKGNRDFKSSSHARLSCCELHQPMSATTLPDERQRHCARLALLCARQLPPVKAERVVRFTYTSAVRPITTCRLLPCNRCGGL